MTMQWLLYVTVHCIMCVWAQSCSPVVTMLLLTLLLTCFKESRDYKKKKINNNPFKPNTLDQKSNFKPS